MLRNNNDQNGTSTNTHPACAACKHQRKRCTVDCTLAPYFPADKSREFQAVHRVFGVANVAKIIRTVNVEDRKSVADSLIWEAYCRQQDPVLGAYGEYKKIYDELKLYKSQIQIQNENKNQNQLVQLPAGQGGIMTYKSVAGLIGWNGTTNGLNSIKHLGIGGGVNNNTLNFSHDNENAIVDFSTYGYSPYYVECQDKLKQERDFDAVIVPLQPQQRHSINGYNQQHYLSGKLMACLSTLTYIFFKRRGSIYIC
ncbi:DUF260 domain-containing protein [Cephalotus follicularis]|uniref:DUF260 domain-containing protein n=1 Tax=Cephalotus follicularis TaxID=3775 RepID=A0A1Q3C6Q9_CEPFO|nr:DUF260 domain-containing protein [Cephalotus follicularis]